MTRYFHSGTPKNDAFQWLENRFTHYRLFSMYGDYRRPVMRWLRDLKEGIDSVDAYFARYPAERFKIEAADRVRRQHQREQSDKRDFDTIGVLKEAQDDDEQLPTGQVKDIMLDSGAFTVWKSGGRVTRDEVIRAYSEFIEEAGDLFGQVWLVNLDEIPGKPGKAADDPKELRRAADAEDRNLIELQRLFGSRLLPVIHQSDNDRFDRDRLKEVLQQAMECGSFLCVSPDNSRSEKQRVTWARAIRDMADEIAPTVRLHGLATTGNVMANGFGFYSVDSEAWSRHARYGSLDLYEGERYGAYHVGIEQDAYDTLTGQHIPGRKESYWNLTDEERAYVHEKCEQYRFLPFSMVQWSPRARMLVNMGELGCFTAWEGGYMMPEAA